MKIKPAVYWSTTTLTAVGMTLSAALYLTRNRKMMAQFKALGYPEYFPGILGVFKLLGVAALLSPGRGLLKEWAYAGFSFTFLGAAASHLAKRQTSDTVSPLAALAVLAASYLTRPPGRQVADSPRV